MFESLQISASAEYYGNAAKLKLRWFALHFAISSAAQSEGQI
jgi:hypothetical protein